MKRKLPILLSPVAGLVMFGAVVLIATFLTNREYTEPYRAPAATVDPTPRVTGLADERADAEAKAKATLYEEAEYRTQGRGGKGLLPSRPRLNQARCASIPPATPLPPNRTAHASRRAVTSFRRAKPSGRWA